MEFVAPAVPASRVVPPPGFTSCDLVQTMIKLQRAAQLITSTLDLDALLDRVASDLSSSIGGVEVSLWLSDTAAGEMVLKGVRGCTKHKQGSRLKIGCEGMVGHVAATGKLRYARDVRVDPYYIGCEPHTLSEVTIPLKSGREVIGVLSIDHEELDAFSEDQLAVFQALAGHVSIAIENARRFQTERLERARMEREAREARVVQEALFPRAYPLLPGFTFDAAYCAAGEVTGDWFDFIDLGDDRIGVVLADVSGKGTPAALLMSATRAVLRSMARLHASPGEVLWHVNQTVSADFPLGKFVTMIYGVLDARSRRFTFGSAGHPRPLLIADECSVVPVDTGMPLGLGSSTYPDHVIDLPTGSRLLLYSDGITEAADVSGEEFGVLRLMDYFCNRNAGVNGLIDTVRTFGRGGDQIDDATAVLIRSR